MILGPLSAEKPEQQLLEQLAEHIDAAVQKVAHQHHLRGSQEPDLTSRVLQAIEHEVRRIDLSDVRIEVDTQIVDSIGSSNKSNSGADAYISIVRTDGGRRVSKGLLVQAKRESSLERRSERQRLGKQCRKMRRRTDDAYVWVLNEEGVRSVQARPYATAPMPNGSLRQWATSPGELIKNAAACTRGDPGLGRDLDLPVHKGMRRMVDQVGAERAGCLYGSEISDRKARARNYSAAYRNIRMAGIRDRPVSERLCAVGA